MALPTVWISFDLVHVHPRTRIVYFYSWEWICGQNIDVWSTWSSVVTMATIHLPIQIWLFLFIPPGNLPPHKNWRGLKISNFASLSWRIALKIVPRVSLLGTRLARNHQPECWFGRSRTQGLPHGIRSPVLKQLSHRFETFHLHLYSRDLSNSLQGTHLRS